MSRTDRPVLELPAVPSDADVSVDALTLELTLEHVTLESPLEQFGLNRRLPPFIPAYGEPSLRKPEQVSKPSPPRGPTMASADKFRTKPTRLYRVKVGFLNPNADYETTVHATNQWNAVWLVSDGLMAKRSPGIVTHVNGKDVMELR